jgi:hypothetical protein
MARGPHLPSNLSYSDMAFSPAGKHVYFVDLRPEGGAAKAQLVMDGKPGPFTGHQNMVPVFSPDDSRWAYNAVKFGGKGQTDLFTVVDGAEVPYIGLDPMFTADNKLVAPPAGVGTGGKLGPAPKGSRWAGVVQPAKPGGPRILYVDGKAVDGAENCDEVLWSPDGKRYMATCSNNAAFSRYVVLDGTKGPEYQAIVLGLTKFSADSSRAIYVGSDKLAKRYVVIDGVASAVAGALMSQTNPIVTAPKGGRYAYLASNATPTGATITLILDGKPVDLAGKSPLPGSLGFTADGAKFAFAAIAVPKPGTPAKRILVVDGVEMPGVSLADIPMHPWVDKWWTERYGPEFKYYQFSPDGKHVATFGKGDPSMQFTVFVDGKPLVVDATRSNALYLSWSPDSKHVFWSGGKQSGVELVTRVFVDGQASSVTYTGSQPPYPGTWGIGADGVLSVLAFEGADAKRYRVTPDRAVTIDTVLAAMK